MPKLAFILSTGRTGTQFFEDYINQTSNTTLCLHEPAPSRRFKILSNMLLKSYISEKFVNGVFKFSRKKIYKKVGSRAYIESNNFLFGSISAIDKYNDKIKILHIIRNPITYIQSHLNHRFWEGFKKFTTKYVPFWIENLQLKKELKKDPIYLLAERWGYVNKQIETYSISTQYKVVKFENLFSKDKNVAVNTLLAIREFFNLEPLDEAENLAWLSKPKNISKRKQSKYKIEDKHIDYLNFRFKEFLEKHNYYPLNINS